MAVRTLDLPEHHHPRPLAGHLDGQLPLLMDRVQNVRADAHDHHFGFDRRQRRLIGGTAVRQVKQVDRPD